jgi:hypothetical protein
MPFNARIWLAEQLHCDPESLGLEATQDRGEAGEEAVYRRAGARVGRVVVSGTRANLGGHERRLATSSQALTSRKEAAPPAPSLARWSIPMTMFMTGRIAIASARRALDRVLATSTNALPPLCVPSAHTTVATRSTWFLAGTANVAGGSH